MKKIKLITLKTISQITYSSQLILLIGSSLFLQLLKFKSLLAKEFSFSGSSKLIPKGFTASTIIKEIVMSSSNYFNFFNFSILYYNLYIIAIKISFVKAKLFLFLAKIDFIFNLNWGPTEDKLVLLSSAIESKKLAAATYESKAEAYPSFYATASLSAKTTAVAGENNEAKILKIFRQKEMFSFSNSISRTNTLVLKKEDKNKFLPLLFNYLINKNDTSALAAGNNDLINKNLLFSHPLILSSKEVTSFSNSVTAKVTPSGGKAVNLFSLSRDNLSKGAYNYSFGQFKQSNQTINKNWYLSEDLIKLISAFFKSIYCLISKPKFINTQDKIIIEILYFITIPDYKIFKWYNFIYNSPAFADKQSSKFNAIEKKNISRRKNKSIKLILRKNNLIKKTLFKLNNTNITNLYFNKFIILFKLLSSYFKKPIELNLIRLHKSNYDSNILAQLFYLILKKKNIRLAIHNLYTKNKFSRTALADNKVDNNIESPAYISGLYIHIGGRLMREPIIPRKTTKKFEKGAIATGKVNFVDTARITKKNKKGAYTIKIAFAQNFMFK